MPIKSCQEDNKPGYKWGEEGKCYTYKPGSIRSETIAHEKALNQAKAIHSNQSDLKISFDYDGVLSTDKGKEKVKSLIDEGNTVYIVTARMENDDNQDLFSTAKDLGIPNSRIYFTNHKDKWEKLKELGMDIHYDNNQEQIDKINQNTEIKGILFS